MWGSLCVNSQSLQTHASPSKEKKIKRSVVAQSLTSRGHHTALKLATPSLHAPHSIACSESSLGRSPCHYQLGHLNFRQGDLAACKLQWDKLSTCFVGHCLQLTARPRPAPGQVTGWPYTPQQMMMKPPEALDLCCDFCADRQITRHFSTTCVAQPPALRVNRQDALAEWSKALAQGASPKGRGFEPHTGVTFI